MKKYKILIINGPNLNKLGIRQPEIYGKITLKKIRIKILKYLKKKKNINVFFYQSNSESKIVKTIQKYLYIDAIIINPAAFSYYSISILDSLLITKIKFIEVHISNIYSRNKIRHKSIFSKYASAIFIGSGYYGYIYAINYIYNNIIKR